MEFHISRIAREKYQFNQNLFSYDGNIIFANFHAARVFTQKMNAQRDLLSFPEQTIKAGQLNAMGLIDEIFHHIFRLFDEQKASGVLGKALVMLEQSLGKEPTNNLLHLFVDEFPPSPLFTKDISSITNKLNIVLDLLKTSATSVEVTNLKDEICEELERCHQV